MKVRETENKCESVIFYNFLCTSNILNKWHMLYSCDKEDLDFKNYFLSQDRNVPKIKICVHMFPPTHTNVM